MKYIFYIVVEVCRKNLGSCSVPWVKKDCGALLRTAQEVTGSLILCSSGS